MTTKAMSVEGLKVVIASIASRFRAPASFSYTKPVSRMLIAAALSTTSLTSTAQAITLKEELLLMLQQHPQLKAGADSVSAASEGVNLADSFFLPSVAVTGDSGYKNIDNPSTRAVGRNFSKHFDKLSMTVTQNIFDGSRKDYDKNAAEMNQKAVSGTLEETRQALLLQGANAYIDVLRQMALVRLSRKSEGTIAHQLDLEDERVKKGGGTSVDVLLSKTRLQRSKEQRIVFEGNLRDAVTRYTLQFGHAPDLSTMEDPTLDYPLVPKDIDVAVSAALETNPLVINSNRQIDIARIRQRSVEADYFPRVDVVGAANMEDDREGTIGNRRDYSVTVQATWNLFTGFSTRSAVAEAAHGYSATINNHLFVNRRIEEEVRLAWQAMMTACNRRMLLVNAVTISAEVHASRVRLQQEGQETTINVLDAVGEVFNAEINEVGSIFDEKQAIYRLAIAMGLELEDVLDLEYTPEVGKAAKVRYEQRCNDRLLTVATINPAATSVEQKTNPLRVPEVETEEALSPFAESADDQVDEESSDPFKAEDSDDEDDEAANPFADPKADDSVLEDETEDDSISLSNMSANKPASNSEVILLEDNLDENDDAIGKSAVPTTTENYKDTGLEDDDTIEDEDVFKEDELEDDDKVSILIEPTTNQKADTEWDDELKSVE